MKLSGFPLPYFLYLSSCKYETYLSVSRAVFLALAQSLNQFTVQILCLYVVWDLSVCLTSTVNRFFLKALQKLIIRYVLHTDCFYPLKIHNINFGWNAPLKRKFRWKISSNRGSLPSFSTNLDDVDDTFLLKEKLFWASRDCPSL